MIVFCGEKSSGIFNVFIKKKKKKKNLCTPYYVKALLFLNAQALEWRNLVLGVSDQV